MSTFFKLRHKPTGLFYKPSKYGSKRNLSKDGKVYHRRPSLRQIGGAYNHPIEPETRWGKDYETRKALPEEWEVVPFVVTEGTPEPAN